MSKDGKRTIISLVFGVSLSFLIISILRKLGFPYDGLLTFISCMVTIWIINFKDKIFK